MSRRRRGRKVTGKRYIRVRIVCACNRVLGYALKNPGTRHPYHLSKSMKFIDLPTPTATSGKAIAKCPDCYADVQVRWDRIVAKLDELDRGGMLVELDGGRRDLLGHADAEIRA